MGIPWDGMGWDRHNLLWDGMGWDRKICPMDKPGKMECTSKKCYIFLSRAQTIITVILTISTVKLKFFLIFKVFVEILTETKQMISL